MNTDERILQILDNSACLSQSQLLGYIRHNLYPEELRAVELHLSTCALCNDALEGLELQQDAAQLLASLTPPVLPALPPREKPKEKKEPVLPVVRDEKPAVIAAEPAGNNHVTPAFRPRKGIARPLGIAAALVLGLGALWYVNFREDDKEETLAGQLQAPPAQAPAADHNPAPVLAEARSDEADKAAAEKRAKDSLLIARKEEARKKAQADSGRLVATRTAPQAAMSAAESTASPGTQQDLVAARKMAAAPVAAEKEKEEKAEDAPKKELSDFELGMQKYRDKNYASALMYFKSAESDKDDPKHWDAVYYSGLCNRYLNKDRRARKMFERVVEAGAPQKKAAQKQLDDMKKKNSE